MPGQLSVHSVMLDEALKLLALPMELGPHPADQQPVNVNIGRCAAAPQAP